MTRILPFSNLFIKMLPPLSAMESPKLLTRPSFAVRFLLNSVKFPTKEISTKFTSSLCGITLITRVSVTEIPLLSVAFINMTWSVIAPSMTSLDKGSPSNTYVLASLSLLSALSRIQEVSDSGWPLVPLKAVRFRNPSSKNVAAGMTSLNGCPSSTGSIPKGERRSGPMFEVGIGSIVILVGRTILVGKIDKKVDVSVNKSAREALFDTGR